MRLKPIIRTPFTTVKTTSTGAIVVPPGTQAGDLILVIVETANQVISYPAGYNEVAVLGTGTSGDTGSTRLTVFFKIAGAGEPNATIPDPGDHMAGMVMSIGNIDASLGQASAAIITESGADIMFPPISTQVENSLCLFITARGNDTGDSIFQLISGGAIEATFLQEQATNNGNGGGVSICQAVVPVPTDTGQVIGRLSTAGPAVSVTIQLWPIEVPSVKVSTAGGYVEKPVKVWASGKWQYAPSLKVRVGSSWVSTLNKVSELQDNTVLNKLTILK